MNPAKLPNNHHPAKAELQQLPAFEHAVDAHLGILHVYAGWKLPVPVSVLSKVAGTGAVPMLDWSCGESNANVAAGRDDTLIHRYAQALKEYHAPVFLRWYYEMDEIHSQVNAKCRGTAGPMGYIEAWRHIWRIFQAVGARNVAFVWAPSINSFPAPGKPSVATDRQYYPGDRYVDWVGVDGYTHIGASFTERFSLLLRAVGTQRQAADDQRNGDAPGRSGQLSRRRRLRSPAPARNQGARLLRRPGAPRGLGAGPGRPPCLSHARARSLLRAQPHLCDGWVPVKEG